MMSSLAEKQSWSSQTRISCGERSASARAVRAARAVISNPTRDMALRSKSEGASVTRDCPAMTTAFLSRCGRARRKDSETMIADAAPSDVGQHWSLVRGAWIMGDDSISARV